jgi:Domain of unknown function (DUF4351)
MEYMMCSYAWRLIAVTNAEFQPQPESVEKILGKVPIMQMTTSWVEQNRYGREQARQATETIVKRCLMRQLGGVPSELLARVRSLSLEQLESLYDVAIDFTRIENLHDWLNFD